MIRKLLIAGALAAATQVHASEVSRLPLPGDGKFPIAAAVTVPAGYDLVYLSGNLPSVANPDAPKGSVESFGDTQAQTASVLKKLGDTLAALGLSYADVVAAHVYMVGDPNKGGEIDFAGMNASFGAVFGSESQPNKPARSTVKVAGLVLPGALVEIDFVAAKPPKAHAKTKK